MNKLYLEEKIPNKIQYTWQYLISKHSASVCLWYMLTMLIVIVFANLIAPFDPEYQDLNSVAIPPAWDKDGSIIHIFGTDRIGRDIYSKIIYGCRITFGYSFVISILAALASFLTGLVAMIIDRKYFIIYNATKTLLSIPPVLIIALAILLNFLDEKAIYIAIGLSGYIILLEKTINLLNHESKKEYVTHAKLEGASTIQQITEVIMPNIWEKLLINGLYTYSVIIIEISSAGFLGLGGQIFAFELGFLSSQTQVSFYDDQYNWLIPVIIVITTLGAINIIAYHIEKFIEKSKY